MATQVAASTKLRNSPGSLYLHITTLLRRRIRSGEWQPGQKVPILEALAPLGEERSAAVRDGATVRGFGTIKIGAAGPVERRL